MNCKDYIELIPLMMSHELEESQIAEVETHIAVCDDCRNEYESVKKIWNLLGELPQPDPSDSMREGFNKILINYRKRQIIVVNPFKQWIYNLRENRVLLKHALAFNIFILLSGIILGYLFHQPRLDYLSSQVSEMKQLMMLSLLQDPSASQRIRAVTYTEEMSNVNTKVIDALLTTLNEDPNVNVRLVTLEALAKMAGQPRVREGLVRSIELQDSPIIQSAIADIMVRLHEKSSVKSLQKLLDKKDLNQMVKINIEKSIQQLI